MGSTINGFPLMGFGVSLGGGFQTCRILAVGVAGFRAASNHRFRVMPYP